MKHGIEALSISHLSPINFSIQKQMMKEAGTYPVEKYIINKQFVGMSL